MTCVIGLIHNGQVWMGGDSAGAHDGGTMNGQTKKVWRQGPYLIGIAGTYGLGQAIKRLELPEPWECTAQEWIEKGFAGFLADNIFQNYGDEEALLVGFKGHLFQLDNHYGAFEPVLHYIAIGGGSTYAMGSIYSTAGAIPYNQIKEALEAASFFHPGSVRPPFTILGSEPMDDPEMQGKWIATTAREAFPDDADIKALGPIGSHIHHV